MSESIDPLGAFEPSAPGIVSPDPAHLRVFVDQAPVAIAMFDSAMRYVAVSQRWLKMHGLDGRSVLGTSHYEVFPEVPPQWREIHRRCLAGEALDADEDLFVRADGKRQWVRWSMRPWSRSPGRVDGAMLFVEEITARKEAEARREAVEASLSAEVDALRQLHQLAVHSLVDEDRDALFERVLAAAIGVAGADYGTIQLFDARTRQLRLAVHRGLPAWWAELWQVTAEGRGSCGAALASRRRVVVEDVETSPYFTGTDRETMVKAGIRGGQSTPIVSRSGEPLGVFSTHSREPCRPTEQQLRFVDILARQLADLLDHMHATRALRESEERLRLAGDAAQLGFWDLDVATGRLQWSPEMAALLGIAPDEPVSRETVYAHMHPEDRERVRALLPAAFDAKGSGDYEAEYRVVLAGGSIRWIAVRGRVTFATVDGQRRPIRALGAVMDITARRQAVEAAQGSEATLRAAIEAMSDAVFVTDADARFVLVNEAFAKFHRFPDKASSVMKLQDYPELLDVFLPSGEPAVLAQWAVPRALRGETAVDQEYQVLRKDTGERWIGSYNLAPIRDAAGAIVGSVVIGRDITQQKAISEALQSSEQRYRNLAEQITDGIFVMDAGGQVLDANQAGCHLLGSSLSELRGRPILELLMPDDAPRAAARFAELRAGIVVRDVWRIRRQDGSEFRGEFIGRQLADARIQGVVRDMTQRFRAEEAIRGLEAQHRSDSETLHALLSTTAQAVLEVDESGLIRTVNPALEAMLGWERGELVGRSHLLVIPAEFRAAHERRQAAFWAAPKSRSMGQGGDLFALRKDGNLVPVEISLAPITTPEGRRVFAFISDVSGRRREETARAAYARALEDQAERLRRLALELTLAEQRTREEISRMLHDGVQQLLFAVKLQVERAERRLEGGSPVTQNELVRVRGDLQAAIAAARDLAMELAPPILGDGSLSAALTWLAAWVGRHHGLTVDCTLDGTANPASREVRTLVFGAVREILFNVVKHAGVSRVALVLAATREGCIRVTVTDQGVGFEPSRISDPVRDRSGLGLASVRERLRLVGGNLEIVSQQGHGTQVTLVVPRQMRPTSGGAAPIPGEAATVAGTEPQARARRALRIVIVDDHAIVRQGLRDLLEPHPQLQIVGEAAGGLAAIAMAHALHPDVMIVDVSMPDVDGVEVTRRVRAEMPTIRILALSTESRPERGHRVEAEGAIGYFCKGDDSESLVVRLLSLHAALDGS